MLRAWEDLDRGDLPEGTFWHEETAALVAIALPLLGREPLFGTTQLLILRSPDRAISIVTQQIRAKR